ncbi:hypothetical protein [Pseudomonas helleri]|uniref:hypothetical protein n=1 Tax=Pseudomonas helleri TaxID=1608996 RepID=UPI003FCF14C6
MTDVTALEAYTGQIAEAAAMSGAASAKQHEYIHGDADSDVITESGPVPTIAKQARLSVEATAGLEGKLGDPSEGPSIVAFCRDTVYDPGTAGVALRGADVTPWEFADKLIYKPGANPAGWDWAPAINEALAKYGEVSLGFGGYGVRSSVEIAPGYRVKGKGPGHAGGTAYSDIFAARIIALPGFVGDAVFISKLDSSENVLTAPQLEQFRLDLSQCEAHGIHFLDVYDGVKFDNLHVVGTAEDKYACWIQDGGYGLGQTLLGTNCQFLRRPNSSSTLPVALFQALNESTLIGCKFFGSSGGVLASVGPAVEFKGCSGMTLVGCSTAFSADGIVITDHPTRKTIGFSVISHTFEAHTRTAFAVRGSAARRASQVHLVAPRYYDSVFAMQNAIDIDFVESSDFDCQFKRAIVGEGADQNNVLAQRQSYLTDKGTNTLIISRPNSSDPYYGINKRIRAIGGITSDGGIAQRVAVFTAESGVISVNFKAVVVNRATIGRYYLPAASAMGDGFSPEIVIRSIGAGSALILPIGSDLIEGKSDLTIVSGGKARLISDGVSSWYLV